MGLTVFDNGARFGRTDPFQALFELISGRCIDVDHLREGHGGKEGKNDAKQQTQAFHLFISSFSYESPSDPADSAGTIRVKLQKCKLPKILPYPTADQTSRTAPL